MTIGLLISGDLGNLALCYFLKNHELKFVMTDYASNKIIESCKINKIPLFIGSPKNVKINSFIKNKKCNILISVNYILRWANSLYFYKELIF